VGPLQPGRAAKLQIESLRYVRDLSPLRHLTAVTDLEVGGDWRSPRIAHVDSIAFQDDMPQLRELVLHSMIVDSLDYAPLLHLPQLKTLRVMKARGMTPKWEELVASIPALHRPDERAGHRLEARSGLDRSTHMPLVARLAGRSSLRRVRDDNNSGLAAARLPRRRVRRSATSLAQQPLESNPVRTFYFEDLRRARCPSDKRYPVGPNAESCGYRSQGGRRGLSVHGAFADTDHQHAPVLATDPRASRPRPNPDCDPHKISVTLASARLTAMPRVVRCDPADMRAGASKSAMVALCRS
jgi:hypothetical protein